MRKIADFEDEYSILKPSEYRAHDLQASQTERRNRETVKAAVLMVVILVAFFAL